MLIAADSRHQALAGTDGRLRCDAVADRFLELLASEAPAGAFEALLADARRRGAAPAELAALEEETATALRVRAVLEERRRREQELAALYATAGDLTSMREVGAVLQAIVRRARELLACDTTYLMLIDEERDDTYMRVTDGTVSADFEHVRLDLGAGLGGLVAATASPYFTADYFSDARFAHIRGVDAAVGAEGLVAILGVPLKIADRVLGVLFAAYRRKRPFASHEVTLLSSLAAHAAVALENARLFTEGRHALADLETATAQIRADSEAVERAAAMHERLTTLVLSGGGIADVAEAVTGLLGGSLRVEDAEGRVLATTGDRAGRVARATVSIVAGAELLGSLVHEHPRALTDGDHRSLERAALVTALVLLNQRSLAEAEQRVRGELVDDLFDDGRRDEERARRGARRLSMDLDEPHAVVVCACAHEQRRRALTAAGAVAGDHGGIAAEHRGRIAVLLPGMAARAATQLVAKRLGVHVDAPVTVGGAGPAAGPHAIAAAHSEAERCVGALLALGREGADATLADLGASALVLTQAGRDEVDTFLERTLGPVRDYDAARGTALVGTLEAYFREAGNLSRTAVALHVHQNTLYQRLERVASLLGEGWREPDRALDLHLALRLQRLAALG